MVAGARTPALMLRSTTTVDRLTIERLLQAEEHAYPARAAEADDRVRAPRRPPHPKDRVAAGQQALGERMEDLVERVVSDRQLAREGDQRTAHPLSHHGDVPRVEDRQRNLLHR